MKHRGDDIRKRFAKELKKRKAQNDHVTKTKLDTPKWPAVEGDKQDSSAAYQEDLSEKNSRHPLFSNFFLFKCLISACLVLIAAITYKSDDTPFDRLKPYFSTTFTEEFQFAAVNRWYESNFGNPLAFLMNNKEGTNEPVEVNRDLPASGKIQETFKDNGEGVKIETSSQEIKSIKEGYIIDISKDPKTGLTVVIQHADNSYSSYGELEEINVSLYQFVDKGSEIGKIHMSEENKGVYFFAIKQGENYIDPKQVISFE
ncbi:MULTISPECIES: M23 family metallopeptidase [Bacillus]|uniref:Stage IV sporulation protein FA n=2 Tax=Bacillus TaxID=1386 RepID=A0A0M4FGV9_9BACI|nr:MULTISPECIES: M23 family metallopeptidase [Bacillus]ALC81849.1 stage IV sporulation protein FA [Bacillus gobiensis]MBP1083159.1 stage IV sporulation protein FA [Bacillus capparidis]MED1097600.1 M23 family metallopeptidase [Bacillus capparidis]